MSHLSLRHGRPPEPSAPPLPSPPPYKDEGDKRGKRSLHAKVWKNVPAVAGAFPVFQDQQGQRYHEPLDWKVVQRLKESVSTYGVQAAITVTQIESHVAQLILKGIKVGLGAFGKQPDVIIMPYTPKQIEVLASTNNDWAILCTSMTGRFENHPTSPWLQFVMRNPMI